MTRLLNAGMRFRKTTHPGELRELLTLARSARARVVAEADAEVAALEAMVAEPGLLRRRRQEAPPPLLAPPPFEPRPPEVEPALAALRSGRRPRPFLPSPAAAIPPPSLPAAAPPSPPHADPASPPSDGASHAARRWPAPPPGVLLALGDKLLQ